MRLICVQPSFVKLVDVLVDFAAILMGGRAFITVVLQILLTLFINNNSCLGSDELVILS